jgi:hypothetical protein
MLLAYAARPNCVAHSANAAAARAPPLTEDCRVLVGPGPPCTIPTMPTRT